MAHCPLLDFICTWAVCTRSHEADTAKISNDPCDLELWPVFLLRNDARHIVTSWVVCVPHMKWIGPIGTKLPGGHGKGSFAAFAVSTRKLRHLIGPIHFICGTHTTHEVRMWTEHYIQVKRTKAKTSNHPCDLDPLTFWPWNGVRHIITSWVVCVPHMKWIGPIRTEPRSGHGQNFERPLWPWPLTFWPGYSARHILTSWVVCVPHMKWICPIRDEASGWTRQKLRTTPVTLTFDLFTRNQCATHRHLMGSVCTTYEVIWSNRDGASERTRQKLRTTPVTLAFDLLTKNRCATHCHLMGCVCTTYEVIRSNRDWASERTRQKLQTTRVNLTFDLLTRKWCATHRHFMGCVCTTYEVNWSNKDGATERTRPKLQTTAVTLTFDLLTRKWCTTHRHLMGCVCTTYEVKRSNRDGAMERTWPKLQTTAVTLTFDLFTRKWCATHRHLMVVCVPHMKWIGPIGTEPWSGHGKNFERPLWPSFEMTGVTLTFDLLN